MVVSPAVMRKAYVGALLTLFAASSLSAQEAPPETPASAFETFASGTGTLAVGSATSALPWIETAQGPLVALAPIVDRLGGQLVVGAFGASFTLVLGESQFVVADGSAAVTRGAEIVPLSQPVRVRLGAPYVPVDLVPRVWGVMAGVTAAWDAAAKRLEVAQPVARELPVDVSVVHSQGISTVVLRFPVAPRLRVEPRDGGWELVAVGDRFVAAPPRPFDDPLLRLATVAADRITLLVADGVAGEHYRLGSPDRVVFDLYQPGLAAAAALHTPSPSPRRGLRTVVLDPGHGGSETGAIGPAGTMEKELTLALARALGERLGSELGLRVALTRTDDVDLGLDERSAFANQNKADLFLSIHFNSTARGDARGAETYFLSLQASDERAADAAAIENLVGEAAASPGSDAFDVQLMLWDLAQSTHLAASQRLANLIQEELNRSLSLPDRGVKQAPFRVLMGAAMPAVLVELGFISAAPEEKLLRARPAPVSAVRPKPAAAAAVEALVPTESRRVTLWLPAAAGLLAAREVDVTSASELEPRLAALLAALFAAADDSETTAVFPAPVSATSLLLAADGTLYVDLRPTDGGAPPGAGSTLETQRVYAIVHTVLRNEPRITSLVLLWNGAQRESLAGHVDTRRALVLRSELEAK